MAQSAYDAVTSATDAFRINRAITEKLTGFDGELFEAPKTQSQAAGRTTGKFTFAAGTAAVVGPRALPQKNKLVSDIATRMTKDGTIGVRITRADKSIIDITAKRVKEYVVSSHPKAPNGTLERVKFKDFLPGSKGYKRIPTRKELDYLKSLERPKKK